MIKCTRLIVITLIFLFTQATISFAQPASSIDLTGQKPERYSERRLMSEQSSETGYTDVKGFFQNLFTHYNYFFNANNKVNEIIERAKDINKDDYTQLLSFYNYSLDNTSKEKVQIDSIMYKVTAAVLLHDLRSDWVDDMYMLMGKAFLLKKDFDSASLVFQYINYAWGPKDVGYDLPIGSNISNDKGIFTISSEEKKHLIGRVFNPPLSRNESFLWRVRTFLEQGKTSEADGLLAILRVDPNFPKRLKSPLHEMIAYSFYKQQLYDSSAWHLQRALSQADGAFEHARWEYLIGQMLSYGKNNDSLAASFFTKSIAHTTDPLMEVFARLNIVNLNSNKKGYLLDDNIRELHRLGRKDRFVNYRDIIYYVAALLEIQDKKINGAVNDLNKSLKNYNSDNPFQQQKSFLLLADTYFDIKEFRLSYNNYDSIKSLEGFTDVEKARIEDRRGALKIIAFNLSTIEEQDSLQRVAIMDDKPRKALIKKLLKQLLKEKGIKELDALNFGDENVDANSTIISTFGNNTGAFYFNSPDLIFAGQKEFKVRWGNRPNVDNWQRQEAFNKPQQTPDANPGDMNMAIGSDIDLPPAVKKVVEEPKKEKDLTYEGMMADLPLRPDQKQKSDSSIAQSLFSNGITFQNNLRDYPMAIYEYEELLRRFPKHKNIEQATYNLSYCYWKLEKTDRSDSIAALLKKDFPQGQYTAKLAKGFERDPSPDDTTMTYQHVYDLFLSGDFENAQIEKAIADKKYGQSNWTPQLIFIEAVYYISRHIDHRAISKLEELVRMYPTSSLTERSNRMIDVLLRRQQIEDHLTYYTEPLHTDADDDTLLIKKPKTLKEALQDIVNGIKSDSVAKPKDPTDFIFDPTERQYVVMQLENVDKVFINEVGNSFNMFNRQNYSADQLELASEKIDDQYTLVYFGTFPDADAAVAYTDKVKPYVAKTIVPWLPANKYKFSIISISNLQLLQKNKQVAKYNEFINRIFPSKF